jgi:hypothetical protein
MFLYCRYNCCTTNVAHPSKLFLLVCSQMSRVTENVLNGICALPEFLRDVLWWFVTEVSGHLIGPIFKGQVVQKEFLVSILIIIDFEEVSLWFRE